MVSWLYSSVTCNPPRNDVVLHLDIADASLAALLLAFGALFLGAIITKRCV
jgi:hypothetical protein